MNNAMMFALDNRYRDAINLIINDNANPYYALKEYRLASYYAHLDMIDSSIYYADKCIKMKPLCYDPVMIKASIYDKLSQKDKQIQIMQDYLSKEQKEPRAWVAMIDIYIKMKNYKKAEETFEKAIKYNPNNPQILSKKAEIEKDKAEKVVENLN
jgi:pentatricopeptide repeat protein